MISKGTRVAIVDDVEGQAETTAGVAEEASLDPFIISESDGEFENLQQLFGCIQERNCGGVICDHRLSPTGFASFTGAEFVASLFDQGMPAVLLSTFAAIDGDTSIKLYRARIPSLIARSDLDPRTLMDGLSRSEKELAGYTPPERKPWRTLVRVEGVSKLGETYFAESIVHTWEPELAIRYPLELIEDESIEQHLLNNDSWPVRLFAEVNVGCTHANDLFLKSFEWAPEPNVNDFAT